MSDTAELDANPRASIGDNRAPIAEDLKLAIEGLAERLETEFAGTKKRTDELAATVDNLPDEITDLNAGDFSDAVAQITAHVSLADAQRKAAREPVLHAQRQINGWFDKHCFDVLDSDGKGEPKLKQILLAKLTEHEQAKVEKERQRRAAEEAEARRKAAEAERLAQEAARKAEDARRAEAQRIADEEARVRLAARAEQLRIAEEARKQREADEAAAAAIKNAADLDAAIKLEEQQKIARAAREAQEAIDRKARELQEASDRAAREATAAAERERQEAEAKASQEAADRARSEAEKAERATNAKAASLHTVRGDMGSSSSLTTKWAGRITSRDDLLKSAADIWPFIKQECLDQALNAFVKVHQGNKKLEGCVIAKGTHAQVRG